MDLVASVGIARTALNFVEGGPLEAALAELNMSAAVAALQKTRQANDKRAQVWSAVNHLEGAQAAIESKLQRRGRLMVVARYHRWEFLVNKHRYILALMALCYRYLGEERLAQQAFTQAKDYFTYVDKTPAYAHITGVLVSMVSPVALWDEEVIDVGKYEIDWPRFELPPL